MAAKHTQQAVETNSSGSNAWANISRDVFATLSPPPKQPKFTIEKAMQALSDGFEPLGTQAVKGIQKALISLGDKVHKAAYAAGWEGGCPHQYLKKITAPKDKDVRAQQ